MKYCTQCGAQMKDDDKFCMSCGSAFQEAISEGNLNHAPLLAVSKKKPVVSLRTKMIVGFLLAIVLAAGGFLCWKTYGTEAQVEKKLDLAVKYLSDNNYEQAILAFNDAIKIDPKEVKGYQGLARTYNLQGKYDEARNTYEKGLAAVSSQNKQTLQLGLAGMYMDQNQLSDAEQAYSEIMNSSPTCLEAYWGLAMVYQQEGENDKAETILRQAVTKNPNEYRGYNTLALFLFQNNKNDEAFNNIVQSLALELNQQDAYLVLDSMYQNNWAELQTQISSLSNQQVTAMLEFYSYYAAGDYINAINTYQNKLAIQSGNQKAKILAAIAMVKYGDKTSAEAIIKQINITKLNTGLLSDFGRYYLAAGDQAKAKQYGLKALQVEPINLNAVALLQAINSNDADAKNYTTRVLLYSWKPVKLLKEEIDDKTLPYPGQLSKNDIINHPATGSYEFETSDTKNASEAVNMENIKYYEPILEEYRKVVEEGLVSGTPWSGLDELLRSKDYTEESFGYALKDFNNDNVPELVLLTDDYSIIAIYSLINKNPNLLGEFWSRHSCKLKDESTLIVKGSGGAWDTSISTYVLSHDGKNLVLNEEFGMESYDDRDVRLDQPRCYHIYPNGKKVIISKNEFDEIWSAYLTLPQNKGLVFAQLFG